MLPFIVVLIVVCVLGVVGVTGYLIDQSAERHERSDADIDNKR